MGKKKETEKPAATTSSGTTRKRRIRREEGAPFDEPKRSKLGRPTKLTPEVADIIVRYVRAGNYLETAAAAAGIGRDTLHRWLRRGREARSGAYSDFAALVEKALAEAEARDVLVIGEASKTHWQAAAWRLERKFPDRWGRRVAAEVVVDGAIDVVSVDGSAREKLVGMFDRILLADPVESAKLVGSTGANGANGSNGAGLLSASAGTFEAILEEEDDS